MAISLAGLIEEIEGSFQMKRIVGLGLQFAACRLSVCLIEVFGLLFSVQAEPTKSDWDDRIGEDDLVQIWLP